MLISKFKQNIKITDIKKYISVIEKQFSIHFPESYICFLEKYNGGEVPDTEYLNNRKHFELTVFYGVGQEANQYSLEHLLSFIDADEFLQLKMFPIAETILGDRICIGGGQDNYGHIYFKSHDDTTVYLLEPTLLDFISKCKSKPIGYIRTIDERLESVRKKGLEHRITEQTIAGWQAEIDKYSNMEQEEVIL